MVRALPAKLPNSLLEEIEGAPANDHPRKKFHKPQLSRKEARKQERVGLKQRKAVFFSAPPNSAKRQAAEEHDESPKKKKSRVNVEEPASKPVVAPSPKAPVQKKPKPKPKPKQTALDKLAHGPNSGPIPSTSVPRTRKEKEEDEYMAYLEAKLGYPKGGKKKTEDEDGLDDLLDLASSVIRSRPVEEELEQDEESTLDEEDEDENDPEEWHGIEDASEDSDDPVDVPMEENTPATRYIPPHLRNVQKPDEKDSELILKLTRQLKGLLNRMSEQNMATILDSIEEIYRNNRRNDVTSTLTTLIISGISSHSSLLDSYVVLYAAFVSSLHKIIGIEFAAYFVQNVVSSYEQHHAALKEEESLAEESTEGKECSNLLVLLSELYNFQVISCLLVFDIIRVLLDGSITEFNVELLLKIVRNSGQQLRQDDPSALKDIIQIVQNKLSDNDDALSSRTRFMVETLTNLKNNKLNSKRNATQNQGGEAVERMKKFLSGLVKKRHVLAHEPLRISLEDLHSAEHKGKWWLVGAAWGGDPLLDRQDGGAACKAKEDLSEKITDNALLKLARKQGMNTDIRRSIFVVLMSSDDYVDACDRLAQLNLTEVQQREIVRVLLHCCGNEKSYNPYYTLVCQHLCRNSHSYKITLQFSLWDFLRDLGETTVGGAEVIKNLKDDDGGFDLKTISLTRMKNVAKAYGWWLAKDCVTLAILKPVDFTVLKPQAKEFLTDMFYHIFISSQVSTPLISSNPKDLPTTRNRGAVEEIFIKATRIQTLAMGLVYFMSEAFNGEDSSGESEKLVKWASRLAKDTLRTMIDTSVL